MTPAEMLTLLGYRLEDPNEDVFDKTLKVLMINRAQTRIYTELNKHVVPELVTVESDVSLTNGAFDASDLSSVPLGGLSGGVLDVKLVGSGYDFTRKISFEEYRDVANRGITFTTDNPKRYFLGSKCYVLPDDYDVDVYYRVTPTQITLSGSPAVPDQSAFTVASDVVHDAIAYLAESFCWGTHNDPREEKAAQQAANLIDTLNTTITATESNSIDYEQQIDYSSEYVLPTSTWES